MNKLTKEQADWLIEKIKTKTNIRDGWQNIVGSDLLFEIINQCTQKPFPDFTTAINSDSYVKIHGGGDPLQIGINLSYDSRSVHAVSMNIKQFKYFVKGCQEIVEHLNEIQ